MEDQKSYTVRTETGEIRLMSQEEVSRLVRTTMARAKSGAQNSRTHSRFSRDKGKYTASAEMSRRLSLSPRHSTSMSRPQLDENPEEVTKSTAKKLFREFRSPISSEATSPPFDGNDNDCNTLHSSARSGTEEFSRSVRSRDARFAALVKTVGPIAMNRDYDPQTVSFTVSTEVEGQKQLSQKELNDLVRNSIIRARNNARHKKSRRKVESTRKSVSTKLSDGSTSPRQSLNRKFSWSTVEKSDDEDIDDFRDEEIVERADQSERCDVDLETPLMEPEKTAECCDVHDNIVANTESNQNSESLPEEIFSTPCSSPKIIYDKTCMLTPNAPMAAADSVATSPLRGYDAPLLSPVLSAGGESVLSDKDICRMVKQSMDKAKLTRQEISELLEDTPSGVTKMDVADIVEGTMRRARESARSLESSLSPRHRRPVSLELNETHDAPLLDNFSVPSTVDQLLGKTVIEVEAEKSSSIDDTLNLTHEIKSMPPKEADESDFQPLEEILPSTLSDVDPAVSPIGDDVTGEGMIDDTQSLPGTDEKLVVISEIEPSSDVEVEEIKPPTVHTISSNLIVVSGVQPSIEVEMEAIKNPIDDTMISPPDIENVATMNVNDSSCCFFFCCDSAATSSSTNQEVSTTILIGDKPQQSDPDPISALDLEPKIDTCDTSNSEESKILTALQEKHLPVEEDEDLKKDSSLMETTPSTTDDLLLMLNGEEETPNSVSDNEVVDTSPFENLTELIPEKAPDETTTTTDNDEGIAAGQQEILCDAKEMSESNKMESNPSSGIPHVTRLDDSTEDGAKLATSTIDKVTEKKLPNNEILLLSEDRGTKPGTVQNEISNVPLDPCLVQSDQNSSNCGSKSKSLRKPSKTNSRRDDEEDDLEAVITDEFLAEMSSMKGTKITASELAKLLRSGTSKLSEDGATGNDDDESTVHATSIDDSNLSGENWDDESVCRGDNNLSPMQSPAFCADFMSIFSDFDFRDVDDDYGSASLGQVESRSPTWLESVVEATSKEELSVIGSGHLHNTEEYRAPKATEYESEFAATLDEHDRRRLTFSFSEGRYSVSLSTSEEF
jgi:hypothetical protein